MKGRKGRGRPPSPDVLTPAEWRVVHLAQHGLSNRGIAKQRGVSLDAVKFHIANAVSKLGLENKQALSGWFQAPLDSALGKDRPMNAAEITKAEMALGPLGQISRTVSNIEQSVAWCKDVLGLPHLYTFDTLAFFDCGGVRLFLSETESVNANESVLYFRVPHIEAAYETLKARGVEFTHPPHRIHRHEDGTEEWMAFFNDPDGRPVAIMAQVKT